MKRGIVFVGVLLVALVALSAPSQGALIAPLGSSGDGAGKDLQTILNGMTQGGTSRVNVYTDQIYIDQLWEQTDTGITSVRLVFELAGFADTNSFGVYQYQTDHFVRVQLFGGLADPGKSKTFELLANGDVWVNGSDTGKDFLGGTFGFYLKANNEQFFYSEAFRNPGGGDQMATFRGEGDHIWIPDSSGTLKDRLWTSGGYLLAWEDLSVARTSDGDFQDMGVMVESAAPVPEPGTMMLLGSGLVGLVGWGRKKFRK